MSDVAEIIRKYQEWVTQKQFEADPTGPEAYAHALFVEEELRILKAIRFKINDFVHSDERESELEALINGDLSTLEKVEATYED